MQTVNPMGFLFVITITNNNEQIHFMNKGGGGGIFYTFSDFLKTISSRHRKRFSFLIFLHYTLCVGPVILDKISWCGGPQEKFDH